MSTNRVSDLDFFGEIFEFEDLLAQNRLDHLTYPTLTAMEEDASLEVNDSCVVNGGIFDVHEVVDVENEEDMTDPDTIYYYNGTHYYGNNVAEAIGFETVNGFAVLSDKNLFVTPEMFGAKGDGIADDSAAWQQAINTGKSVIGFNVYKIGNSDTQEYTDLLTVNSGQTNRLLYGNFIDGRQYSTTHNQKNYAVMRINADFVHVIGTFENDNNLPVDASDSNNLSDVGGYAVSLSNNVKGVTCDIEVSKMNGVYGWGTNTNCNIDVNAQTSAYPYAAEYVSNSNIKIDVDRCHRAAWLSADNTRIDIRSKNFYSTGDSSHVLFKPSIIDNVAHLAGNVKLTVTDTGSQEYNNAATYVDVMNDSIYDVNVNIDVEIYGDISNSNNSIFTIRNTSTGKITGGVNLKNNMKVNYAGPTHTRLYAGVTVAVTDSQYQKIAIDTADTITAKLNGLSPVNGMVSITRAPAASIFNICDYAVVTATETVHEVSAYQFLTIKNVPQFNPAKFHRCTVAKMEKYIDGTITT